MTGLGIENVVQTDRFRAMNTDVDTALLVDRYDERPFLEVRQRFARSEERFSRFSPDSELSRLNGRQGRLCRISAEMAEILQAAAACRQLTDGLFEPAILPELASAGYSVSFEKITERAELPKPTEQARPMALRGWQLFPRAGLVRLRSGTKLDLGGIAKGWTVDRVSEHLIGRRIRAGQLNAGGDLRVWSEPGLPAWEIEAAIPDGFAPSAPSYRFAMRNGAAATSSTLRRRWSALGETRHHLIDPRSGLPGASDTVQCTVVGTTAAEAEVAAKTVLLLGSEAGLRWLERTFPRCDALLYKQDGTAVGLFGKHGDAEWKGGSIR